MLPFCRQRHKRRSRSPMQRPTSPSMASRSSPPFLPLLLPLLLTLPVVLMALSLEKSTATAAAQEAERAALLAIASALQPVKVGGAGAGLGAFWQAARWLPAPSLPPCATPHWRFINCSTAGRVSELHLDISDTDQVKLAGEMPWASLAPLRQLVRLSARFQGIQGPLLPSGTPPLPNLRLLDLVNNQITSLSDTISQLPKLRDLILTSNGNLTGPLPVGMSSLKGLRLLSLDYSRVSGSLPSQWSALTGLQVLGLQKCLVSGSLPASYSALKSLKYFDLAANELSGTVPPSWASLNGTLQTLLLSANSLSGPFPAVLTSLKSLAQLGVDMNNLMGPVPSALWSMPLQSCDIGGNYFNGSVPAERNLNITFLNNCFSSVANSEAVGAPVNVSQRSPAECASFYASLAPVAAVPAAPAAPSANLGLIVGVTVGVAVLLVLVALLVFYRLQRQGRLARRLRMGTTQSTREFSLAELKAATKNWSAELGRGGYGSVYKAVLKDGSAVAVKRLDQVSDQGDKEFIREVELLSRVHHRHLVNLVGFCGEKGERALVYEYMGLGSLYDHLHGECAKEQPLSWDSRIKIAIHVAFGIDYLHYGADPPLIHRDIKSANILLSEEGYAKVADFGLCKEAPVGVAVDGTAQLVPENTEVRGSFGYLDPEYVNTSVLSEKSDVYSYGVVLLELITGKKSIHDWQPLAYWAEPFLEDPNKLGQLVDPTLDDEYDVHELQILCDIARSCVYDQAAMRPAIRDVAQALVENLGRVVASTGSESVTDRSGISSEIASSSDPTDTAGMSSTYTPGTPSEYSFRNAASEALLVAMKKEGEGGEEEGRGAYRISMGPDGTKPPVPVGKHFKDTI